MKFNNIYNNKTFLLAMSTCDPTYETCPADNTTTTDAPAVTGFNPLIYAWGIIPVLDFLAGMGNKHALNTYWAASDAAC